MPGELRDDVPTLRRCVELEARLIDDLLDLTRIVRGKLALNFEVADVHALIQAVASMYRSDLDAKSIRVSMQLAAASHYASVDPGRLQQVFWNILKNAAKFTPNGGSIEIASGNVADDRLQIEFTDSGVGMTPANHSKNISAIRARLGRTGPPIWRARAWTEPQQGIRRSPGRNDRRLQRGTGKRIDLHRSPFPRSSHRQPQAKTKCPQTESFGTSDARWKFFWSKTTMIPHGS